MSDNTATPNTISYAKIVNPSAATGAVPAAAANAPPPTAVVAVAVEAVERPDPASDLPRDGEDGYDDEDPSFR